MEHTDPVDWSAALVATVDRADCVLLFNARCEEVSGIDRGAARGSNFLELFVREEERAAVARQLVEARAGRALAPFTAAMPPCGGGAPRWIRWQLTPVARSVLCATGIDVTEEREAATRSRRSERALALGTMTAGLAHELRNPINAAHLQLDLAQRRLARGRDRAGALQAIEMANAEVSRLARLVDEFLLFARPDALHVCQGDLRAVAESSVDALRPEASARCVELQLEPGEPVVAEFDDLRMSQAVHHLVRNAIEANQAGGVVRIALQAVDGAATLVVEDSGPGLPAGAPVFEPFYTTKSRGTGLGLAIVHRIVCDHGGEIAVESRPGHTLFALSLPAT